MKKDAQQTLDEMKVAMKEKSCIISKIVVKNGVITHVETTSEKFKTRGNNLSDGSPATDTEDRVPSSWEQKALEAAKNDMRDLLDAQMSFSSESAPPGIEYYQDQKSFEEDFFPEKC